MQGRWLCLVSILVGGLLSPALSFAHPLFPEPPLFQLGPTNKEIVRAQEQIEQGDFEEAVKTLQAGLDAPDVTDDQLVELYRLLGLASLYLGDEARAREAYERLLQARPDFELPRNAPPKLRQLYARIKEDIKSRRVRPVTLQVDPIPDPTGGEPVLVDARIEDMALGAKAKLFFRRAGDEAYSSVDFSRVRGSKDQYQTTLPAYELPSEATPYEVEYYFEVADAAQRRLAGRGDSFHPLIFQVVPQQSAGQPASASAGRPWYKSPWLWVGVGAVVIGGTAAGVAIATSENRGQVPVTIRVNP
ncbi:tetratricopeptide repeat protein [Hyalangium versicolor]|uniref:tetratricopeptide repeat protein n=1 Tax=Hyalangium versicolor TaxID=2861190 RepID=UPI001CCC588F|nr:tetratricopeptide repeat protein [Hyalangium versicolor]